MMDREYMEDVDTMTDETDEVLNPDYDRVSGSGEMPSLEEFLGVNHSSDGLGASSDPFGMVIGDPVYSDDSMGGFPSSGDGGFAGLGVETATDSTANSDTEEAQEDNVSFKKVMNGSFVRNWVSNNRNLVLVLFILAILHIANRNHAESLIREEVNLQKEVHNLRASSIDIASKLMSISKESAVSNLVVKRKLQIRKTVVPPMQFFIDKFERADSLIKDEPDSQQGTLYDDVYEVYAK
ncbi:MAG: hypothetical protein IJ894_11880 [Bacteroidales bacterium]|nr:hypothetical protein [Bacteroidales bacterium]MBR2201420.1 hypothetical protein [Bacteroidales bacterium]MBR3712996.1 hypothetical protein [Bacteroidales bacterium]